jgi:cobalt/nickel transport system permease protein
MHVPDSMLHGAICPVTAGLYLAGATVAVVAATKSKHKPGVARFSAVAALIFAAQMVNFPILSGTSGHLLGAALAAALIGPSFAVLAMTLVLAVQALVFGDGGLLTLGANGLNMALIGVAAGWLPHALFNRRADLQVSRKALLTAAGGWLSVMMAALAVSLELAIGGGVPFAKAAGAMLGTHAWIGLGEGLLSAALYLALAPRTEKAAEKSLALACAALLAAPFASQLPDGLERAAAQLGLIVQKAALSAPLADYRLPALQQGVLATITAGLCGILLTYCLARLLGKRLVSKSAQATL